MSLDHNPVCTCSDCYQRKLQQGQQRASGMLAIELNDAPPVVTAEVDAPVTPPSQPATKNRANEMHEWHARALNAFSIDASAQAFPPWLLGCTIIGAATIKDGTTHAVRLRDPLTLATWLLYWERNASTTGKGEWAVIADPEA